MKAILKSLLFCLIFLGIGELLAQPFSQMGNPLNDFNAIPNPAVKDASLSIFPNPMTEVLTVHLQQLQADTAHHIQILGISGEPVLHLPLLQHQTSLDLSHLPRGWYTVHLHIGSKRTSKRVFKMAGP